MIDLAFRNITRQKTRTVLTVLGIVIGIAAIVALSSFAEGINIYIEGSLELTAGKIVVQQRGSSGGFGFGEGSDITQDQLDMISQLDGVKEVVPVNLYVEFGSGFTGAPEMVVAGVEPENSDVLVGESIEMEEGRDIDPGERGVLVLGSDLAESKEWGVGDFIRIGDIDFEVIGILEKINNANIDGSAVANIKDVQELLGTDSYQTLYVVPDNVEDSESIAENIENNDDSLSALTSTDIARQAGDIIGQIRLFTFGIGAIAAIVGGLGVLNTMIMSVLERRREIGVMKAIGATRWMILQQILTESAMMSLIGGIAGILLGILGSLLLGTLTGGGIQGIVTIPLALGSLLFALCLGMFGGIYPAWKAASLDPVEALRYE